MRAIVELFSSRGGGVMEPLAKRRAAPARENEPRTNDIARLQILRKECKLSEDDWRALILTLSNNRTSSTRELDHTERKRVIEHLVKLKRALGLDTHLRQWRKLCALWVALYSAGLVNNKSESAMNAWAQRQLGPNAKASARWCNNAELEKLIEAGKAWLARTKKSPLPPAGEG